MNLHNLAKKVCSILFSECSAKQQFNFENYFYKMIEKKIMYTFIKSFSKKLHHFCIEKKGKMVCVYVLRLSF